jgi:NADH-quinone oxidoreductase subunit J
MLHLVVFYILAGMAVLGAALLLTVRNTRHCVILLFVVLLATSGIFLQLHSKILFAAQLLLLAGAVAAMFLFTVGQVDADGTLREMRFARQKWMVLAIALAAGAEAGLVYWSVRKRPVARLLALGATQVERLEPTARVVLHTLFSTYLLSFEIAVVLALVSVIGVITVNRKRA